MENSIRGLKYHKQIGSWPITLLVSEKGLLKEILFDENPAGCSNQPPPPGVREVFRQLEEYFKGERTGFDLQYINSKAPPFYYKVWDACREIPYGRVTTYGLLARRIGKPRAARAVGKALGKNPLPMLIPCHRIIGAQGDLIGYTGGLDWKKKLLELEKTQRQPFWTWEI